MGTLRHQSVLTSKCIGYWWTVKEYNNMNVPVSMSWLTKTDKVRTGHDDSRRSLFVYYSDGPEGNKSTGPRSFHPRIKMVTINMERTNQVNEKTREYVDSMWRRTGIMEKRNKNDSLLLERKVKMTWFFLPSLIFSCKSCQIGCLDWWMSVDVDTIRTKGGIMVLTGYARWMLCKSVKQPSKSSCIFM